MGSSAEFNTQRESGKESLGGIGKCGLWREEGFLGEKRHGQGPSIVRALMTQHRLRQQQHAG